MAPVPPSLRILLFVFAVPAFEVYVPPATPSVFLSLSSLLTVIVLPVVSNTYSDKISSSVAIVLSPPVWRNLESCVSYRKVVGGPAKEAVLLAIQKNEEFLKNI